MFVRKNMLKNLQKEGLTAGPHMDAHGIQKYNDVWDRLLKQEPVLSKEQLYQEGRAMMNEYGIKVYF